MSHAALADAWHNFAPSAAPRLHASLAPALSAAAEAALPVPSGRLLAAYASAVLEAELGSLDQLPDPLSGRHEKPLVDWAAVRAAEPEALPTWAVRAVRQLRGRLWRMDPDHPLALRPPGPRLVVVDDSEERPLPEPPVPAIVPDSPSAAFRRVLPVLLAFNAPDLRQRRTLAEYAVDDFVARRAPYEAVALAVVPFQAELPPLLAAAFHLFRLASGPNDAPGAGWGWPRLLRPPNSAGEGAAASLLVATWLVRTVLLACRPQDYPPSDANVYAPRGLGADVETLLVAWGFRANIGVYLSQNVSTVDRMNAGARAALFPPPTRSAP